MWDLGNRTQGPKKTPSFQINRKKLAVICLTWSLDRLISTGRVMTTGISITHFSFEKHLYFVFCELDFLVLNTFFQFWCLSFLLIIYKLIIYKSSYILNLAVFHLSYTLWMHFKICQFSSSFLYCIFWHKEVFNLYVVKTIAYKYSYSFILFCSFHSFIFRIF